MSTTDRSELSGTVTSTIRRVTEGVFFTTPEPLPRGRHELGRDQVLVTQRERMMIAATELLAAGGPGSVGVREICSRAAASRAAFYASFSDKNECLFAAYDRFISVLSGRFSDAEVAEESSWESYFSVIITTYVSVLQEDLVTARAFQLEMDGFGRSARVRRRSALERLAQLIKSKREHDAHAEEGTLPQYIGAVYAIRQVVTDALDDQSDPDLRSLVPILTPWVSRIVAQDSSA